MRCRAGELIGVLAAALLTTGVISAPVLRGPSERVFGMELVGRHHDPFTVMQQLAGPIDLDVYSQPLTDVSGALLARVAGGVAGYNWLVLLSFPLSAVAAYLLARHLALTPAGATIAALAYAFSPFHLAQAAYHPHIAQTQWLPLYLLALWRSLDRGSFAALAWLAAATAAAALSNFYGGFIMAVITPVAVMSYWLAVPRQTGRSRQPRDSIATDAMMARRSRYMTLVATVGTLLLLAAAGLTYASWAAGPVFTSRASFAFPRTDLFLYSAKWWSYLVPPAGHPLLGAPVREMWIAMGVREGLLEQQVSIGWGIVALGLVAVFAWLTRKTSASFRYIPTLLIVATVALVCSLSPERTIGGLTIVAPSALLYAVVPMFRSYARFGVVVQLMAALLAGIGVDYLRRSGSLLPRAACLALVLIALSEYAVAPRAMWRDVLPTTAHRWVMYQPGPIRAFDCAPLDQESASVPWLTDRRVTMGPATSDCTEPHISQYVAGRGFTHLLVRTKTIDGRRFSDQPVPNGLDLVGRFEDAFAFRVTARPPAIYNAGMSGFFPREHNADWSWRWMGAEGTWTIVNTGTHLVKAAVSIEMSAFSHARHLEVRLDGQPTQRVLIDPARGVYHLDALSVPSGAHELLFRAIEAPTVAGAVIGNGDLRPLSLALGTWEWSVRETQP